MSCNEFWDVCVGMGLRAIDYGALGSVMGHEITHGFDTTGRYSDGYGRLNSWWTLDTLTEFVDKTQCFVEQYGEYWLPELSPIPGPNNTVHDKNTFFLFFIIGIKIKILRMYVGKWEKNNY